ncbi:hypothetical protein [Micrococcoides hystricis]|uniref:DUF4101 domain-containing protein n=1 Tax=Micrococcoides hystricis TaxID=1572761 RepID=A0ABV6P6U5_9MICC
MATEFVDGVSLTDLVSQTGPLPLSQLLTLVAALDLAQSSDPSSAVNLTPDRALFTALGKPRFLSRTSGGVGPEGCLWFALTGHPPPTQRLAVGLLRDDLPRRLEAVVDAYLAGERSLADVRAVLHRLTEPRPLQLGLPPALRSGQRTETKVLTKVTARVLLGVFTACTVLLAGWQLEQRFSAPSAAVPAQPQPRMSPSAATRGWDPEVCLWDRLATRRQAALEGRGSVSAYTYPDSPAFRSETALQQKLRTAGIELSGLQTRLVPGQHDGQECTDPVGLFAWQPVTSTEPMREVEVFALVSGHTQRGKNGRAQEIKPVKQQLSVQLRLHHGRWLISSIHVADAHAQS